MNILFNMIAASIRFLGLVFPELDLGPVADLVESIPIFFNIESNKKEPSIERTEKEKPREDRFWEGLSLGLVITILILLLK